MKQARFTIRELMDGAGQGVAVDLLREKGIVPEKGYTTWIDFKTGDIVVEQEEE